MRIYNNPGTLTTVSLLPSEHALGAVDLVIQRAGITARAPVGYALDEGLCLMGQGCEIPWRRWFTPEDADAIERAAEQGEDPGFLTTHRECQLRTMIGIMQAQTLN